MSASGASASSIQRIARPRRSTGCRAPGSSDSRSWARTCGSQRSVKAMNSRITSSSRAAGSAGASGGSRPASSWISG
ncbi:hypothetical protein [Amycolatopsis lexingtonensis]|uniref:hypothetical protein n=1 Tax=Amycolatopsis lexingtonensis TaxID=218822 RepID=UPI003F70A183